jgi:hypothetical protein
MIRPITFPVRVAAVKHKPKKTKAPARILPFRTAADTPEQTAVGLSDDQRRKFIDVVGKISNEKRIELLATLCLAHPDILIEVANEWRK